MPNHYHLVLRSLVDGEMIRFMGWVGKTHTIPYHAHYHTSALGRTYQQHYKSFPIQDDEHLFVVCRYIARNALLSGLDRRKNDWPWGSLWWWLEKPEQNPRLLSSRPKKFIPAWVDRVKEPLSKAELAAVGLSAQRRNPLGDDGWVESINRRHKMEATLRQCGSKRIRSPMRPTKKLDL